jgi:MFS family permease
LTTSIALGPELARATTGRRYAWAIFILTVGLMLSDYMSRQVLNAVFPTLKAEWSLSDAQLGSLSGIVALMVGVLTFPLSVLADRWGRVRSILLMTTLWSFATLGCAFAASYDQMFLARFFVGVGEAAYGSVGLALILSVFPAHLRASLTAAFMAGGPVGSVFGMALGGIVAAHFGWRWSFGAMALFGFALAALYGFVVTEKRLAEQCRVSGEDQQRREAGRKLFPALVSSRSVIAAYTGSGLQLFIMASIMSWLPSFLNRYYGLAMDKAGIGAAAFLLIGSAGMVACGILADRVSRSNPERKWHVAMAYTALSSLLLFVAFRLAPGSLQLLALAAGMLMVAGISGPAGAMVANLTPTKIHASALATLTLANNLLGLAPGPFVTGWVADRIGLLGALQLVPLAAIGALAAFAIGRRHYAADLQKLRFLENAGNGS